MQTHCPQKLMLNISSDDTPVIPTMGVDLEELTEVLRQNITLPVGKIERLKAIGNSPFLFSFSTQRSSVLKPKKVTFST